MVSFKKNVETSRICLGVRGFEEVVIQLVLPDRKVVGRTGHRTPRELERKKALLLAPARGFRRNKRIQGKQRRKVGFLIPEKNVYLCFVRFNTGKNSQLLAVCSLFFRIPANYSGCVRPS